MWPIVYEESGYLRGMEPINSKTDMDRTWRISIKFIKEIGIELCHCMFIALQFAIKLYKEHHWVNQDVYINILLFCFQWPQFKSRQLLKIYSLWTSLCQLYNCRLTACIRPRHSSFIWNLMGNYLNINFLHR